MQRELPGWIEEMNGRGVRLLGRELDLPQTAATVRADVRTAKASAGRIPASICRCLRRQA